MKIEDTCEEGMISRLTTILDKDAGPSVPKKFGLTTPAHRVSEKAIKLYEYMVIKLHVMKYLRG